MFQTKCAAYLNLIEPWWKVLRSLALKGRRFDAWVEIEQAVVRATAYWNAHKHPLTRGRRRRHRRSRRLGIAAPPNVVLIWRIRHRGRSAGSQNWYSNREFDEVEIPELENNRRVMRIWPIRKKEYRLQACQARSGDRAMKLML